MRIASHSSRATATKIVTIRAPMILVIASLLCPVSFEQVSNEDARSRSRAGSRLLEFGYDCRDARGGRRAR